MAEIKVSIGFIFWIFSVLFFMPIVKITSYPNGIVPNWKVESDAAFCFIGTLSLLFASLLLFKYFSLLALFILSIFSAFAMANFKTILAIFRFRIF